MEQSTIDHAGFCILDEEEREVAKTLLELPELIRKRNEREVAKILLELPELIAKRKADIRAENSVSKKTRTNENSVHNVKVIHATSLAKTLLPSASESNDNKPKRPKKTVSRNQEEKLLMKETTEDQTRQQINEDLQRALCIETTEPSLTHTVNSNAVGAAQLMILLQRLLHDRMGQVEDLDLNKSVPDLDSNP